MNVYIASPYSHQNPAVRQQRFEAVCEQMDLYRSMCGTGWAYEVGTTSGTTVVKTNDSFVSPIEYTHPFAVAYHMPNDSHWWRELNYSVLDRCDALWVLQLDGWQESEGVQDEIEYAESKGKRVRYVET